MATSPPTRHLTGGAPNNDTFYSRAWVYLKDEPVILTVPEIADRYYTMEIVDFMGDNFAYVGTRATGTKAGDYAIVGPDWKGMLPEGRKGAATVVDASTSGVELTIWATGVGTSTSSHPSQPCPVGLTRPPVSLASPRQSGR